MEVYLVGGAVRDRFLGLPIKEKDWCVVGSSPEEMKKRGFQSVGKDFPVFLHPETKEEYALARTERKKAPGYYGFDCQFDPSVTLEQDLMRRDLTINALAQHVQKNKPKHLPLASEISKTGYPKCEKWRIIENTEIESDV